jgi:hypothetical protein
MESRQIDKILKRNPITAHFYLGCFASDQLMKISPGKYPHSMVVNFDPSEFKGSHWVAIFSISPNEVDYYDSLGLWPPLSSNITQYLSKFNRIRFNPYALQGEYSKSCGQHAIFFLYARSSGKSFEEILRFLRSIPGSVDRFVNKFVDAKIFAN